MLKTLKTLPPKDRVRLLAAATEALVPRPRLETDLAPSWPPPDLIDELFAETRKSLNLRQDDDSDKARRSLLRFFAEAMGEQLLSPAEERLARERLGALGSLQLRSYRVIFGDAFEEDFRESGVTKREVLVALQSPDAFEHLPVLGEDQNNVVSLIAKTKDGGREEAHTLLVEAARRKDTLQIANVWRVFHSDVQVASARTPVELLRSFLAVYGKTFILGNREPTRLVEREAIPMHSLGLDSIRWADLASGLTGVEAPGRPAPFKVLDRAPDEMVRWSSHMRVSPLGVLEVQLFFVVSLTSYLASIRSHKKHLRARDGGSSVVVSRRRRHSR